MRGLSGAVADLGTKSAQVLDRLPEFLLGREVKSGQVVNYATALRVTAVLACCRVIAEDLGQIPLRVMRSRKGGGADLATDHWLYPLLYRRPNGWQTSFEFRETLVFHLALVGNAYVFKSLGAGGRVLELIPLEPGRVAVTRHRDMTLTYRVTFEGGDSREIPAENIWHLRAASWNSWMGMEPVRLAAEAIGLSLSLEESHALMHANGVQPSGVYSVEGQLDAAQQAKLTQWIKAQAAAGRRGNPLVLDRSAKWLQQQMSGVDAQHLETRRLQVEEVCRAMRVMAIMVGLSEKTATYASAEQMFLAHVKHTITPWAARIEQSADVNLLGDEPDVYVKFELKGLLRGAFLDRQQGLQIQRQNGVINANEWRDVEDMNPRSDPGGDEYIVGVNMRPEDGKPLATTPPTIKPPPADA